VSWSPTSRKDRSPFACPAHSLIALAACGDDGNDQSDATTPTTAEAEPAEAEPADADGSDAMAETVIDVAVANDFTTLVAAVEAAGLVETLSRELRLYARSWRRALTTIDRLLTGAS
jgi:uncharacterized surface protein with fasciclin (FAS1) repeats